MSPSPATDPLPSPSSSPSVDLPEPPFRLRGVRIEGLPSEAWRQWIASDGSFVIEAPGPGILARGDREGLWFARFQTYVASLDLSIEPAPPGHRPSSLARTQVEGWGRGLDEGPPGPAVPVRAGRAVGWEVVVPDDAGGSRWFLRVYVHGGRIYYLSVRQSAGDPESARYRRRYLGSFEAPAPSSELVVQGT